MTDNIKIISRPKVRFCQFSDNARKEETIGHYKGQTIVRANGTRVKDFVSVTKPVRIVDPTKFKSIRDKDVSSSNCNINTLSHHGVTSSNVRNTFLSDKDMTKIKNIMIQHDTNSIQNKEKNCKIQLDKSLRDDIMKDRIKCLQQKGKENKDMSLKRAISSKNVNGTRTENSQHVQSVTQEKFKFSTDTKCMEKVEVVRPTFKRPKMTKSQSAPSIMKKTRNSMIQEETLNGKSITLSCVTSCYKTVTKNKKSPIKKIILRNISGSKIKTSVEPVIFHKKQDDAKISEVNKRCTVESDVIIEDLAQPEHNSIVCTLNKLKELEQQKIVTNISHLPPMLKSFLNTKISAALDFPLDEAIYKNLVDLSIDERQLPSTIMRNKDPEPQQKDVIPRLSDFFIPEDTKEICEAMYVKSRASKVDDNWNAFKISDRILEWKYSIDIE